MCYAYMCDSDWNWLNDQLIDLSSYFDCYEFIYYAWRLEDKVM